MSTKFLIAVLNWLQEEFIKNSNRAKERANEQLERIKALEAERKVVLQEAALAGKLADRIDDLLS